MKKRNFLFILIIILIILFSIASSVIIPKYKPFTMDSEQNILSCKSCKCIGFSLLVMESYPEQYNCKGIELCQDINLNQCP